MREVDAIDRHRWSKSKIYNVKKECVNSCSIELKLRTYSDKRSGRAAPGLALNAIRSNLKIFWCIKRSCPRCDGHCWREISEEIVLEYKQFPDQSFLFFLRKQVVNSTSKEMVPAPCPTE